MKIAICVSGQPRFANFGAYHQKKWASMLPEGWSVDFYVQSWSQEGVEQHRARLFGDYGLAPTRIDPQYMPTEYPTFFHKIRGLSQHYAHFLCQQQIRNIDAYDVIIRTRHDTMLNTDIMDEHVALIQKVYDERTVAGFGFYPDYKDETYVTTHRDGRSHRGFSKNPTFDDWAIVGHVDRWKSFAKTDNEFHKLLDAEFMNPDNEHMNATYDLDGLPKRVCIPELVWYQLMGLNKEKDFYVGHGYAYLCRPTIRDTIKDKPVEAMTPSDVRQALRNGWVNGAAVLRYSILL